MRLATVCHRIAATRITPTVSCSTRFQAQAAPSVLHFDCTSTLLPPFRRTPSLLALGVVFCRQDSGGTEYYSSWRFQARNGLPSPPTILSRQRCSKSDQRELSQRDQNRGSRKNRDKPLQCPPA